MDRRAFVRGLFGVAAAGAVVTVLGPEAAQAAPLPVTRPDAGTEAERLEADFRPDVDGAAQTEKAQYYYRRRFRRRRVYYYRPRRRFRRVYYRRPIYRRRVYYRPRYFW